MKITDYPLLENINPEDQFIVETDDGTKRASYSLVAGLKGLLDAVYPVGSLYLSYEDVSPAELFGGSWTQINGYFLRAANDTETGGADSISLTVAQMPLHYHKVNAGYKGLGDMNILQRGYWGNDNPDANFNASETNATGGNAPHSNMPSYQDVYVWRRVS